MPRLLKPQLIIPLFLLIGGIFAYEFLAQNALSATSSNSTIQYLKAHYLNNPNNRTIILNEDSNILNAQTFTNNNLGIITKFTISTPVFIYSPKTITITSNIMLAITERYQNLRAPQIIIVAEEGLTIANNVTQIDAWLLTNGPINACETTSNCTETLTSNGALSSNGSDQSRNIVAHLSPAIFFSGTNEAESDDQPRVTYLKELPPRW